MPENHKEDTTKPYKIVFADGHLAVWQCYDAKHAAERAKNTYPQKIVRTISPVK